MKQIHELLSKEMTRKEFLKVVGLAVISLFGVNNFITFMLSRSVQNSRPAIAQKSINDSASAFGSRKFGI